MKAILLAGGKGSRLFPVTLGVSKQLLPVYDKPMVYYPLSVLLLAGIRDVLIISTPKDINQYKDLLGNGSRLGISLNYKVQKKPNGLAEAFILGERFIGKDPVCLILGDNIFYGLDFSQHLKAVVERTKLESNATIFGYTVNNPQYYGVIEFNEEGKPVSIEEKPEKPKSNKAVVGLYFYPNEVISVSKMIKPSKRGELEITSINKYFLDKNKLLVENLGRGFAWLDTGTHESLLEASQFIETIERRQGLKIGCIEEIAFQKGYISQEKLLSEAKKLDGTSYGDYLLSKYSR
ncbi:MAG: glucose-1-phosphate thymidylyltransferase RfbA [Flavobacteriaceae bacterium]